MGMRPRAKPRRALTSIYDWFDEIEQRPKMYLHTGLRSLEDLVFGYQAALDNHGLTEATPPMFHFGAWLRWRFAWGMSAGWAYAIDEMSGGGDAALKVFFEQVREFRKLEPIAACSVRLGERHQRTGKRYLPGVDERKGRPRVIEVERYDSTPLHYLKLHFRDETVSSSILWRGVSVETTLEDAQEWVEEELQVTRDEWRPGPR